MDSSPAPARRLTAAGLFAGIGGLEYGLQASGVTAELLCEWWEPAQAVLRHNFPHARIHSDIRTLDALPDVDIVTAGFPCTDISQAGRTAGIHGKASGLVKHLFKLLADASPTWVVVENVRNMLALDRGNAMEYLVTEFEELGFAWAYRLVDSRFTGVPQRRQRVIMVASRTEDPSTVLFADDAGEPDASTFRGTAYGFYWTEGTRGLGWAQDAVPTLKGGSGLGISSPPAIWIPGAEPGRAILTPSIEDAEALQGFPRNWTEPALAAAAGGRGSRWKAIGNAVTVGVSTWVGQRLRAPGNFDPTGHTALPKHTRWPNAAFGNANGRWEVQASLWPQRLNYTHLLDVVQAAEAPPLSYRATSGFYNRLQASTLRYDNQFALALKQHAEWMLATQTHTQHPHTPHTSPPHRLHQLPIKASQYTH